MSAGDDRVFHYAIVASIALHALILLGFSMRHVARSVPAAFAPIVARIAEPPAAPALPAPPALPEAKPTPPRVAKAAPKALPPPVPAPTPAPAPSAAEPAPAAPAPAAASAAQASAPNPSATASPGADVDADSLSRFRMQVIAAALKYKRYPRVALDNAWEGRADVRVSFNAEGRRSSIVVSRSSGHEILDRQAIDTITKAFVPVPPALRGKAFVLDIPVIYNLKDDGG